MFTKIKSYHNALINKGLEHVSTEFDRRALRLLNFILLYGSTIILPTVLIRKVIEQDFLAVFFLVITVLINGIVYYLNSIGKSQISYLLFSFGIITLSYVAVSIETEQVEVPFVALTLGCFSIFLLKNKTWRIVSFLYAFLTFSLLYYYQLIYREFAILGYLLSIVTMLILSAGLWFVNRMRNKDEKTILSQNETLTCQNQLIKENAKQMLELQQEKHASELLLKQRDMEMILTNNQIQTQLNDHIINRLKDAQQDGELEKNINQIILELHQQNEINTRMKLIEQNLDVVNTSFFETLSKIHPNMTRLDKEFCSYLLIGLSSKEIAIIRNTTVNSVNVTKSRLRKKLGLDSNKMITSYLESL